MNNEEEEEEDQEEHVAIAANENGYYEDELDGVEHTSSRTSSLGEYVREHHDEVTRQANAATKQLLLDQEQQQEEERKRLQEQSSWSAQMSLFFQKYSHWWNLREQVNPNGLANPTTRTTETGNETKESRFSPAPPPSSQLPPRISRPQQQHQPLRAAQEDCAPVFGEPWMVIAIFVLGMMTFAWGIFAMGQHWWKGDHDTKQVWFQMSVSMMILTLMGMVLPTRMRFSWSLYGIVSVVLLVQYAAFTLMFPLLLPTSQELGAFRDTLKRQEEYLNAKKLKSTQEQPFQALNNSSSRIPV